MGGMSIGGGGAQALPQMSTAPGYTPPLSGALGTQMGQSLDPKLFNGMVASPQTTMDLTKLADALKGFGGGSKPPEMPQGGAGNVHNKQDDYQQYLNAFNASHKG